MESKLYISAYGRSKSPVRGIDEATVHTKMSIRRCTKTTFPNTYEMSIGVDKSSNSEHAKVTPDS